MIQSYPTASTSSHSPQRVAEETTKQYLLRLTIEREELEDLWELQRDIEHLGGTPQDGGSVFAFRSEKHRNEAAEVLIDTWGSWYFESVQVAEEPLQRLLMIQPRERNSQGGLLTRFLRRHKFSVEVAGNALEALELLPIHQPQLILLDSMIRWGGADGLLNYLQETPRFCDTPVILLKGPQDRSYPEYTHMIAASFRKPIIFADVLAAIVVATRRKSNNSLKPR